MSNRTRSGKISCWTINLCGCTAMVTFIYFATRIFWGGPFIYTGQEIIENGQPHIVTFPEVVRYYIPYFIFWSLTYLFFASFIWVLNRVVTMVVYYGDTDYYHWVAEGGGHFFCDFYLLLQRKAVRAAIYRPPHGDYCVNCGTELGYSFGNVCVQCGLVNDCCLMCDNPILTAGSSVCDACNAKISDIADAVRAGRRPEVVRYICMTAIDIQGRQPKEDIPYHILAQMAVDQCEGRKSTIVPKSTTAVSTSGSLFGEWLEAEIRKGFNAFIHNGIVVGLMLLLMPPLGLVLLYLQPRWSQKTKSIVGGITALWWLFLMLMPRK